jgi:hypothetical protein
MIKNKKGQVLIMILFIIGVSSVLILVTSFVVNEQIRRIRKIFDSFQAYHNSETGIEINLFYHLKEQNIGSNFQVASSTYNGDNTPCHEFFPRGTYTCEELKIKSINNDINVESYGIIIDEIKAIRTISYGINKRTSRLLLFDFYTSEIGFQF